MTDPNPTPDTQALQDADSALYSQFYGTPGLPPLTAADQDLYDQMFPTK